MLKQNWVGFFYLKKYLNAFYFKLEKNCVFVMAVFLLLTASLTAHNFPIKLQQYPRRDGLYTGHRVWHTSKN